MTNTWAPQAERSQRSRAREMVLTTLLCQNKPVLPAAQTCTRHGRVRCTASLWLRLSCVGWLLDYGCRSCSLNSHYVWGGLYVMRIVCVSLIIWHTSDVKAVLHRLALAHYNRLIWMRFHTLLIPAQKSYWFVTFLIFHVGGIWIFNQRFPYDFLRLCYST